MGNKNIVNINNAHKIKKNTFSTFNFIIMVYYIYINYRYLIFIVWPITIKKQIKVANILIMEIILKWIVHE